MTDKQVVEFDQIETSLQKILEDLQGKNKMRACLFNMVIYAQKDRRAAYLHKVAQKIIEKFPSRIIFVTEHLKSKESFVEAKVSALTANEGDSSIICDLIEIDVSADNRKRIPFTILPHLLPDLPLYIMWGDDPTKQDPLSFNLEKYATRTIFDSETADELIPYAEAIFTHHDKTQTDVADLNWARTDCWRNLFTSIFYSQELITKLAQSKEILLTYNSLESPFFSHTKTQSIFFAYWLASCLNWKIESVKEKGENLTLVFSNDQIEIPIYIKPSKVENLKPGRIVLIEVLLNDTDKYVFKRKHDYPHHIIIETCQKDVCSLSAQHIFEREESGQSLVNEICHEGTSQHYLNMLSLISKTPKGKI